MTMKFVMNGNDNGIIRCVAPPNLALPRRITIGWTMTTRAWWKGGLPRSMLAVLTFAMTALLSVPMFAKASSSSNNNNHKDIPYPFPSEDKDNWKPPEIASTRSQRFPSIEERVKLYMSNWYLPPCPGTHYVNGTIHYRYNYTPQLSNTSSIATTATRGDAVATNETDPLDHYQSHDVWPTVSIYEPRDRTDPAPQHYVVESSIEPDKCFFVHRPTLLECSYSKHTHSNPSLSRRITARVNMNMYCNDVADTLLTAYDHVVQYYDDNEIEWEKQRDQNLGGTPTTTVGENLYAPPLLLQFGDLKHSHVYRYMNIPHIKKFRSAAISRDELDRITSASSSSSTDGTTTDFSCVDATPREMLRTVHDNTHLQPIVWKLATSRHFRLMDKVYRDDTPWESKINMAVFRGQLTGSLDSGYDKSASDVENCYNMRRCRLVYDHANSTFIHAKLTSTRNRMPHVLNGVNLMGKSVTIRHLLQYKGIIMLEGNDVASGLKWALLSQSIVLMPEPKYTSWMMEEWLQPWIHYVPLNENATDVEEKMKWVVEHDDHAQRISERATLWMQDLVYHPDAMEDDRLIQEEIIRRYMMHFRRLGDEAKQ